MLRGCHRGWASPVWPEPQLPAGRVGDEPGQVGQSHLVEGFRPEASRAREPLKVIIKRSYNCSPWDSGWKNLGEEKTCIIQVADWRQFLTTGTISSIFQQGQWRQEMCSGPISGPV